MQGYLHAIEGNDCLFRCEGPGPVRLTRGLQPKFNPGFFRRARHLNTPQNSSAIVWGSGDVLLGWLLTSCFCSIAFQLAFEGWSGAGGQRLLGTHSRPWRRAQERSGSSKETPQRSRTCRACRRPTWRQGTIRDEITAPGIRRPPATGKLRLTIRGLLAAGPAELALGERSHG